MRMRKRSNDFPLGEGGGSKKGARAHLTVRRGLFWLGALRGRREMGLALLSFQGENDFNNTLPRFPPVHGILIVRRIIRLLLLSHCKRVLMLIPISERSK